MIQNLAQNLAQHSVLNAGLNGLMDTLKNNWIGPVFFIIVAGVSVTFLLQREIRKLLVFIVIAAIVGVLIYFGTDLFGQNGSITNVVKKEATGINTILPHFLTNIKLL